MSDPQRAGGSRTLSDYYECTYCGAPYGEWPGCCSECGQLVVRIVDPRPVPDC